MSTRERVIMLTALERWLLQQVYLRTGARQLCILMRVKLSCHTLDIVT